MAEYDLRRMQEEAVRRAREMQSRARFPHPPGGGPAAMLGHLRRRLEAGGGFPHEMGLFLGYPPEDVRGFWENGGRNYKYSGVWKVYSDDVEGARAAFRRYSRCRDAICKRLAGGISLVQMFRAA